MKTLAMYRLAAIQSVFSDFDRYLGSLFEDSSLSTKPLGLALAPAARLFNQTPAVDIKETENAYLLEMELPGCDEKNIEVHLDGSNLTIAFKQENKTDESKDSFILHERRVNAFNRSFKLPENADPEGVSAVLRNGVLSLTITKQAEAQKKTIQINAA